MYYSNRSNSLLNWCWLLIAVAAASALVLMLAGAPLGDLAHPSLVIAAARHLIAGGQAPAAARGGIDLKPLLLPAGALVGVAVALKLLGGMRSVLDKLVAVAAVAMLVFVAVGVGCFMHQHIALAVMDTLTNHYHGQIAGAGAKFESILQRAPAPH